MRPLSSTCIKLLGLYLGSRSIISLISSFSSLAISQGFGSGMSGFVDTLTFATAVIVPSSLQLAFAFLLIFRTDIVLDWAQFPEAQIPSFGVQKVLRIGIALVGLLHLVGPLGDLFGRVLGMFLQGQYGIASNPRDFLPSLATALIAFGLIRFSHKLAALIERWQATPIETD